MSSEPGRTAFVCAMPMELRPLARKLSLHRTRIAGVTLSSGTLGDREVVAIVKLPEVKGHLLAEPDRVEGQYNIYDSIPGMKKYSPIWQFNYVIVPRKYEANTLKSEADCLKSGYEIKRSNVFEN